MNQNIPTTFKTNNIPERFSCDMQTIWDNGWTFHEHDKNAENNSEGYFENEHVYPKKKFTYIKRDVGGQTFKYPYLTYDEDLFEIGYHWEQCPGGFFDIKSNKYHDIWDTRRGRRRLKYYEYLDTRQQKRAELTGESKN